MWKCIKSNQKVDANDFEEDDSIEQALISASEASKNLEIVHAFLLQQENSSEQIKLINSLNRYINLKKINTMKQPTIDLYFDL